METDDAATAMIRSTMTLCETLGVRALKNDPAEIVLALDWQEGLCTAGGGMHGGTLMALADSAGGVCAFSNLPEGAVGTSTIESKANFLGAVRSGEVIATARPLHVGKTTIVVETELRLGERLIAKTTQTQVVLTG